MNESPVALCECGCGEPAPIARRSNTRLGHVKGQPVRFIRSHVGRAQRKDPVECSVEECDRQAKARGLCEGHRRRVAKTGKTGGTLRPAPPIERILRVAQEEAAPASLGPDALPCWLVPPTTDDGRRRVKVDRKDVFAYRITYEEFIAPLPEGLVPDHLCRRPACVNPWHLDPVPGRVNVARGIGPTAENGRKEVCQNGHLLTEENVRVEGDRRRCRICVREYAHEYYLRRKEERHAA